MEKHKLDVIFLGNRKCLLWPSICAAIELRVMLMHSTKSSLVPEEDQGTIFLSVTTAPGSSLQTTVDIMDRVEASIKDIPQIANYSKVSGYGMLSGQGSNFGMYIIKLKDWSLRPKKEDNVQAVIGQIYARTAPIKSATVFAMSPGMIPGYGLGNSVDLQMQDRAGGSIADFFAVTQQFIADLSQRPEIERAFTSFAINSPQRQVDLDAAPCKRARVAQPHILGVGWA